MAKKIFGYTITQILMAVAVLAGAFFLYRHLSSRQVVRQKATVSGPPAISEAEWKAKLKSGEKFSLGIFAEWCGHCKNAKPAYWGGTKGLKSAYWFDATNSQTPLFEQFDVKGFPSVLYFDKGSKVGAYKGSRSESDFKDKVGKFLDA
jgi:thiol-disulfide isomerase/thioredoxin